MRHGFLVRVLVAGAALGCGDMVSAQDQGFDELALRVVSLRPNGACVVDRGQQDLVQVGDHVVLELRNGRVEQATVTEVQERTALVELRDATAVIPVATRGHVLLPRARRAAPPKPTATEPGAPTQPDQPKPTPTAGDDWQPGMPLLGTTRAPRPAERGASLHGRVYATTNLVRTLGSFTQSYLTTGADVDLDNPNGDGGTLHFHGDFNESTEWSGHTGSDLRLYDLSYEHGGTRFEPLHWQVGRFLPRDMPEFGVLDGGAVGYRREGGDRFGASFGYLPKLDDDMESLADLQFSAWYTWNQDIAERVSVSIGYQKTWHRLEADRDLVIVKSRYLPGEGWDASASVWVDFYSGRDNLKQGSVEVTRCTAFLGRRWQRTGGVELYFDHESYPDLLRKELPQTLQPQTLQDAHQDRLTLHAFTVAADTTQWFTRLTGFADEERDGGAVEFGVDKKDLLQADTRTTLALFGIQGTTSSEIGARLQHGGDFSFGRLDLLYELGFVHHEGFPSDRNDLVQHRLGGLLTAGIGRGWDATFFSDATLWDQNLSFGIGIYMQRLF